MPSKFQIYVDQSMKQPPDGGQQQHQLPTAPKPTHQIANPNDAETPINDQVMQAAAGDPTVVGKMLNDPKAESKIVPRYIRDNLAPNMKFYFDERKLYPVDGGEFSFEELNLGGWLKRQ